MSDFPESWQLSTLADVGEWKGGGTPSKAKPAYWKGEIPWVSPKDMKSDIIRFSEDSINEIAISESSASLIPAGAILVVTRSGILRHTLPLAVAGRNLAINQDLKAITVRPGIENSYVFQYMKSNSQDILDSCMKSGTTVESIETSQLKNFPIPIPPLPEQKKIAEILSGIDTQRQALAKKVANASMLLNALGEKIFSSLDGETVPLGELCNPKQWQTISTNQLTTSGYPVYGANGKIGYFTEYNHKEPVLAVTCRGATCGNLTLVPAFSYVTGNSMCLDNPREDTSPEYLFQFLAWRGLKDVISGSAQPQITRSPLQAVEVVLPSKEKQRKIVTALESVNNVKNMVNIALSRHDLLKQAIASDLLSGRKRVSV
jgi:type I restriction enzyme S subunit